MQEIMDETAKREFGYDNNLNEVSIADLIADKFKELRTIVIQYFDERVWLLTRAGLAIHVACILEDITNPAALILLDGASTEKTTVLDFFDGLSMNLRIDKFTPASFLTQSANVKVRDLPKVDLLRQVPYKTMLIPEMGVMLNQPKEILEDNYGTLARVLDASGLSSAGGVHGKRELKGDYIFGLLGASTPLNQTAWNTMGKVGSRLIFLHAPARFSRDDRKNRAIDILQPKLHYKTKRKAVREAVHDFLQYFFAQHRPPSYKLPENLPESLGSQDDIMNHCGYLPRSVIWSGENNNPEVIEIISLLAEFLTACRSPVTTWTERGEDGRGETNSSGVTVEGVERFTSIISNVARAHALISGRDYIDFDELDLIIAIVLSSMPDDRRKAIELLFDTNIQYKKSIPGEFTITELSQSMGCTDKTAKLIMRKLELCGIGQIKDSIGGTPSKFILDEFYSWLATDDFLKYYRPWGKSPPKKIQEENEIPF